MGKVNRRAKKKIAKLKERGRKSSATLEREGKKISDNTRKRGRGRNFRQYPKERKNIELRVNESF